LADADTTATADDIASHFNVISATDAFSVPGNIYEELFGVVGRLGVDVTGSGPSFLAHFR
jgi:hypothetical protein